MFPSYLTYRFNKNFLISFLTSPKIHKLKTFIKSTNPYVFTYLKRKTEDPSPLYQISFMINHGTSNEPETSGKSFIINILYLNRLKWRCKITTKVEVNLFTEVKNYTLQHGMRKDVRHVRVIYIKNLLNIKYYKLLSQQ